LASDVAKYNLGLTSIAALALQTLANSSGRGFITPCNFVARFPFPSIANRTLSFPAPFPKSKIGAFCVNSSK